VSWPENGRLSSSGRSLLLGSFFLTGASSLVFEVVWTRLLLLSLGATALAMGAVLGAFMAGMAVGSHLAGSRLVSRLDPIVAYAVLEGWAGAYGLATPHLLRLAEVPDPAVQFAAAIGLLLPATIGMGASLPILARAFGGASGRQAVEVGWLYAANTAGAVLGPLLAVFWLFPGLGLGRTLHIASVVDVFVCVLVLASRRVFPVWKASPVAVSPAPDRGGDGLLRGGLFVSGAAAMVYEVAWTRTLSIALGSSVYGVTIMLSTYLFGIAAGSALVSLVLSRVGRRVSGDAVAWLLAAAAVAAHLSFLLAHWLPRMFVELFERVGGGAARIALLQFATAAVLMLPAALCLGAMLPLAAGALAGEAGEVGRKVSRLYTANLVGSAVGAAGAGALLLGSLGVDATVRLASAAALLFALVLAVWPRRRLPAPGVAFAVALVFVLLVAPQGIEAGKGIGFFANLPYYADHDDRRLRQVVEAHQLLFYQDGTTASVAVVQIGSYRILRINGKSDASTGPGDMQTQLLLAHLPLLSRPAKRVAVIGWGSGVTAGAVLSYPVARVDAFEIEPAVVSASHYFDTVNGQPLSDPRLRLVIGDARAHLRRSTARYDVIIAEPSNPWQTGVANLFTQDYFRLVAARLNEDGVLCQWFHLYGMSEPLVQSLVATFRSVFPEHLVFRLSSGRDTLLLGSRRPIRFSGPQIRDLLRDPRRSGSLASVGIHHPFDILSRLTLDPATSAGFVGSAPINTDDNMYLELMAPGCLYLDRLGEIAAAFERHRPDLSRHLSGFGSTVEVELEQAASLFTVGEHEEALALCERANAAEPTFEGYKLLGQVLDGMGRTAEARQALIASLSLAGGNDGSRAFVRAMLRSIESTGDPSSSTE
jgi:spermidine synthase